MIAGTDHFGDGILAGKDRYGQEGIEGTGKSHGKAFKAGGQLETASSNAKEAASMTELDDYLFEPA